MVRYQCVHVDTLVTWLIMYSIFWHEVMSPESFYKAQTNVLCLGRVCY